MEAWLEAEGGHFEGREEATLWLVIQNVGEGPAANVEYWLMLEGMEGLDASPRLKPRMDEKVGASFQGGMPRPGKYWPYDEASAGGQRVLPSGGAIRVCLTENAPGLMVAGGARVAHEEPAFPFIDPFKVKLRFRNVEGTEQEVREVWLDPHLVSRQGRHGPVSQSYLQMGPLLQEERRQRSTV